MTTHTTVREQLGSTSLTTQKTNSAKTEVSELKMAVLVDEQIVRLQVTAKNISAIFNAWIQGKTDRCTIPR